MPLLYSFLARGSLILAEYTPHVGNFRTVAQACLQQTSLSDSKFTILCDGHTFNFMVFGGCTYLVVADEAYGRMIPFAFLERVRFEFTEKFEQQLTAQVQDGVANKSTSERLRKRLKFHMEWCMQHPEEISRIAAAQKKVTDVKGVAIECVGKLLERGDKVDSLAGKVDALQDHALQFRKKGAAIRQALWWHSCWCKLLAALLLVLLAIAVFLAICFGNGANCTRRT